MLSTSAIRRIADVQPRPPQRLLRPNCSPSVAQGPAVEQRERRRPTPRSFPVALPSGDCRDNSALSPQRAPPTPLEQASANNSALAQVMRRYAYSLILVVVRMTIDNRQNQRCRVSDGGLP